jgi:protein-disulfide isomerase
MKPMLRAVLALALATSLSGCQKVNDLFGLQVRTYLLAHPEVLEEAMMKLQEKKQLAAADLARTGLASHRAKLENDPRDFVANPAGKITVVEFFDYRCGYCKLSAPEVVKVISENPDIRFVFKEFPIFGGPSNVAAKVALSPAGKAHGLDLYRSFMTDKALDEAGIDRHLVEAGIDPAQAKAAGDGAQVQKQLEDTRALAAALNIEGTPAFIVGDHLIPGADLPALRAAIAEAKAGPLKHPG